MDYAINILQSAAEDLKKSRDALDFTMENLKGLKSAENKELRDEFLSCYNNDKRGIDDKLDSLLYAIEYLSKSGTPINCRSDIEESVWVKVFEVRDVRHADEFIELITPIVGKDNVKKASVCAGASFIIFIKASAINQYHDAVFGVVAECSDKNGGDAN